MSAIDVDEILEHQLTANMLSMPYDVYSELFDSVATLGDENEKLRKLCERLIEHVRNPPCEGCGFDMNCDDSDLTRCDEWSLMITDARELGIEVER